MRAVCSLCSVVGPDLAAIDRFASTQERASRLADVVPANVALAPTVCFNYPADDELATRAEATRKVRTLDF
jgi:hypothetical protein